MRELGSPAVQRIVAVALEAGIAQHVIAQAAGISQGTVSMNRGYDPEARDRAVARRREAHLAEIGGAAFKLKGCERDMLPARIAAALCDMGFRAVFVAAELSLPKSFVLDAAKRYCERSAKERRKLEAGRTNAMQFADMAFVSDLIAAAREAAGGGAEKARQVAVSCEQGARRGAPPQPTDRIACPRWRPTQDLEILRMRAERASFAAVADRLSSRQRQFDSTAIAARWHRLRVVRGIEDALTAHIANHGDRYAQ